MRVTEPGAYLLLVLPPRGVQRLDEGGGVADEHGVARGAHDHAQHRQPDVRHALGRLLPVADAQHVAHGLEEGEGVELAPRVVLQGQGCLSPGRGSAPPRTIGTTRG